MRTVAVLSVFFLLVGTLPVLASLSPGTQQPADAASTLTNLNSFFTLPTAKLRRNAWIKAVASSAPSLDNLWSYGTLSLRSIDQTAAPIIANHSMDGQHVQVAFPGASQVSPPVLAPALGLTASVSSNSVHAANNPPNISAIPDQLSFADLPLGPISFILSDDATPPEDLVLLGTSSDTSIVPDENIVFYGDATNRTLFIVPARAALGKTRVTVTAIDANGAESSQTFNLTLVRPTSVSVHLEAIDRSPPPLSIEQGDGRNVKLAFDAAADTPYVLEYRDSLNADWRTLTTVAPDSTMTRVEIYDPVQNVAQRFYRLGIASTADIGATAVSSRAVLDFVADPGVSYTVEYSDSLEKATWQTLTNISNVAVESAVTVADTNVTQPQRFYRLRIQ